MNYLCKTIITACLLMLMIRQGKAQTIVHIGAGGQLFISEKTAVSFDSLVMVPASNGFLLGENDISKLATPNNAFPGVYLKRVYCFSHPLINYSGSLGIFYNEKEAADGNIKKMLVQAYTGFAWYPLKEDKARNAQHNVVGGLGLKDLSFNELLLGYETEDPGSRKALIVMTQKTDASVSIGLYPNPVLSVVNIQVNGNTPVKSIQLYDAAGKLMMRKENSIGNRYSFNVSQLASGIYTILVETNIGKLSKSFVKE